MSMRETVEFNKIKFQNEREVRARVGGFFFAKKQPEGGGE
jgi:hypothetical protein